MAQYVPNEFLSRLVGYVLYEVALVQDYLQLRFQTAQGNTARNLPLFNLEVWPVVEIGGAEIREPDSGYGDALRRLIGRAVTNTVERTGVGIRIELGDAVLSVHPELTEVYVEIGMLSGFEDSAWMVWRPGEESFGDVV